MSEEWWPIAFNDPEMELRIMREQQAFTKAIVLAMKTGKPQTVRDEDGKPYVVISYE